MKNKTGVTLFLLLFLTAVFSSALSPQEKLSGKALYDKLRQEGKKLFKTEGFLSLSWTPDGKSYYVFEDGTFKKIDAATGVKTNLFDDQKIINAVNAVTGRNEQKLFFNRFNYLGDGQKILFSAFNKKFVFDLTSGQLFNFFEPEQPITGVRGRRYEEVFSPDLNYRAYTRNFNLYIKDMEGKEVALTTDGHEDLRNGFPDWVYPEELGQYEAFWWSPDSQKIAYMQFDESPVTKYPILNEVSVKPRIEFLSYPKAGANNPIIRFFIVDIKNKNTVRINTGDNTDVYLYRGQWTPDGKEFTFHRLNRLQNRVEVLASDPNTGQSRILLRDEDPCYIDEQTDLIFLRDNKRFIWTSERSGWREIYLYDMTGKLLKQLTAARLPVRNIVGVDEPAGLIYFTGYEKNGTETHLYKVKFDGSGFVKLTKAPGTHRINFAPGFNYYSDTFSNFDQPTKTILCRADGTEIRTVGQTIPAPEFNALNLKQPERFTFKSADGFYDLDALLYFPANFDPQKKYPVILSVYGGPGSKGVTNSYKMNDSNQTLAQLGFLVAVCDYRGVSGRGKSFQNLHYLKLGQVEFEDHVVFVKHLGQRPYVDLSRVGMFGHSYGGYFTILCLLKAPDIFHVGVAGAPVTDWKNYDSIYTERYMRRPQDNPDGYEKGSCLTYAKNLKGRLFIHHGAVDDNVHLGNTIQLVHLLLRENKKFDLMIYPDQQHGIMFPRYGESRVDYFIEHLKPDLQ